MKNIIKKIEELGCKKLNTVVHLGAGLCLEMEELLRLGAEKIILVECNPDVVEQLRFRVRGLKNVTIIPAAVNSKEGEVPFCVINNPRESSLLRPDRLFECYPNLEVSKELTVSGKTLDQLTEHIEIDKELENLLLIEVQGAEAAVIGAASKDILKKFTWIAVRSGQKNLYEGASDCRELNQQLEKIGFAPIISCKEVETQPFQDVLYMRNTYLMDINALKQRIRILEDDKSRLQQAKNEQQNTTADCKARFEKLAQDLEAKVKLVSECESRITKLDSKTEQQAAIIKEHQDQIQKVTKERDDSAKLASERLTEIKQISKARDEQFKLADDQQTRIQKITQEFDQQAKELAEHQSRLNKLTKEKEDLAESRDQQAKLADKRQTQIEQLTQERGQQAGKAADARKQFEQSQHTLQEKDKRIAEMEAELAEFAHRQRLLDDEMIKAEAQIDLIKDVLLREPGI